VAAWHIARDAELFEHWDRPNASGVLSGDGGALAPEAVQTRAVDLLLATQGIARLECVAPVRAGPASRGRPPFALPSYGRAGTPDWLRSVTAAIA
jgi:hypothetical protein